MLKKFILPYLVICIATAQEEDYDYPGGCGVDDLSDDARTGLLNKDIWPMGRVPYELDRSLRDTDREIFAQAVAHFHKHTCIRLKPRKRKDAGYIVVQMSNDLGANVCGFSRLCYTGTPQGVYISYSCSSIHVWVHEIVHALCLSHEQVRPDRDEFIEFPDCPADKVPRIRYNQDLRGHIYDYNSLMHEYCYGGCRGRPLDKWVDECGPSVTNGLSVLDADKINDYYDCQGCHRHRWYNPQNLTYENMASLVDFAINEGDTDPIYLCRGYLIGDILPGIYKPAQKVCEISRYDVTMSVAKHIQVFGLPTGPTTISRFTHGSVGYQIYDRNLQDFRDNYVAVGRDARNNNIYVAFTSIVGSDGNMITALGSTTHNYWSTAWFPISLIDSPSGVQSFEVMGCTMS